MPQSSGAAEPCDAGEVGAWIVADAVARGGESGGVQLSRPGVGGGVVGGGAQFCSHPVAVGGGRGEVGDTLQAGQGGGDQSAAVKNGLGEQCEAAGYLKEGGEWVSYEVAGAVR